MIDDIIYYETIKIERNRSLGIVIKQKGARSTLLFY